MGVLAVSSCSALLQAAVIYLIAARSPRNMGKYRLYLLVSAVSAERKEGLFFCQLNDLLLTVVLGMLLDPTVGERSPYL